jgi:hypothetical protein
MREPALVRGELSKKRSFTYSVVIFVVNNSIYSTKYSIIETVNGLCGTQLQDRFRDHVA